MYHRERSGPLPLVSLGSRRWANTLWVLQILGAWASNRLSWAAWQRYIHTRVPCTPRDSTTSKSKRLRAHKKRLTMAKRSWRDKWYHIIFSINKTTSTCTSSTGRHRDQFKTSYNETLDISWRPVLYCLDSSTRNARTRCVGINRDV